MKAKTKILADFTVTKQAKYEKNKK